MSLAAPGFFGWLARRRKKGMKDKRKQMKVSRRRIQGAGIVCKPPSYRQAKKGSDG